MARALSERAPAEKMILTLLLPVFPLTLRTAPQRALYNQYKRLYESIGGTPARTREVAVGGKTLRELGHAWRGMDALITRLTSEQIRNAQIDQLKHGNPLLHLVEIRRLPADRWRDFRDLRLQALKSDPSAYGSSFEEEETLAEGEWRRRIQSVLFALSDDRPIGMIVYVFEEELKSRHIAEIYGFYVSANHRGKGVGTRLLEHALLLIRKNGRVIKVKLAVNPEQRAAVKMYKKAGFVVTGRVKKELKVGRRFYGMLFMEKWL